MASAPGGPPGDAGHDPRYRLFTDEFARENLAKEDPLAGTGDEPQPFTFGDAEPAGEVVERPLIETAHTVTPPQHEHYGTLVWLHGFGADPERTPMMFEVAPMPGMRLVVPRAPKLPITVLDEHEESAWFDLHVADLAAEDGEHEEDEFGLRRMAARVHELLDGEAERVGGAGRVVLGGFAQGGAMAAYAGLTYRERLAGVTVACGWVPSCLRPERTDVPVLAFHGSADRVVPPRYAARRLDALRDAGVEVMAREQMGLDHTLPSEVLLQMQSWWTQRCEEGAYD